MKTVVKQIRAATGGFAKQSFGLKSPLGFSNWFCLYVISNGIAKFFDFPKQIRKFIILLVCMYKDLRRVMRTFEE